MSRQGIAGSICSAAQKHAPEILTGFGIGGMVFGAVTAVRATPKALKALESRKEELETEKLPPKEAVRAAGKYYIPAGIIGLLSAGCLIGACSVGLRRNAALIAAYTLSDSTLREYREKVTEAIGEKKEQAVRDAVSKDRMEKNPVREVILTEKGGNTVCYDVLSGRYFKSDRDRIVRIMNDLNRRMRDEMTIPLNDFYYELGLDSVKLGDMLGWNIDRGYIDLDFSSQLDATGTPCLVIDYLVAPVYDYR